MPAVEYAYSTSPSRGGRGYNVIHIVMKKTVYSYGWWLDYLCSGTSTQAKLVSELPPETALLQKCVLCFKRLERRLA